VAGGPRLWRVCQLFQPPGSDCPRCGELGDGQRGVFSDANLSSGEREDRSNRWIFLPLLVIGLLSAFLPAYTERKGLWVLDGDTARWLGVFLYVAGGALRIWPT
jgi:protein-S-isoprenylcysteine O-methyltransferase Ste14